MFVDEFGDSVLISHNLIAFLVVSVQLAVLVLFYSVSIFIVSNEHAPWDYCHQKAILVISSDASKGVFLYSEAKLIISLDLSGLWILLKSEAIFGVINFILSMLVFADIVTLLVNKSLLSIELDDLIAIFVVFVNAAFLVFFADVAIFVNVLLVRRVSNYSEPMLVIVPGLSILLPDFIASLVVRFAIDKLSSLTVVDHMLPIYDPHLVAILIIAGVLAILINLDAVSVLVVEDSIVKSIMLDLVAVAIVFYRLP